MSADKHRDLSDPAFVRNLFDEMAKTYGAVNIITSFGFSQRWRRQCIRAIDIDAGSHALDLMTGMGELCPDLAKRIGPRGKINALDISPVMCNKARGQAKRLSSISNIEIVEADALSCSIPDNSMDYIFSSFGLKTFNSAQLDVLAYQVQRILRPGGSYHSLKYQSPKCNCFVYPTCFI